MKIFASFLLCSALFAQNTSTPPAPVKAPAKPAAPGPTPQAEPAKPAKGESLKYNLNWASGLSLGEAILTSAPSASQLNFAFQMDASVPGFSLSESVDSRANPDFCSVLLYKRGTRGKRKVDERTEFDPAKMKATRTTERGGKSELSVPACAKDALTYIYFLRRELAAGRLPAQQRVYYGGPYSVSVKFTGTEQVTVGGESLEAEKITATVKGAAADVTADLFFAKDSARTPLLIQVPLKAGKFNLELIR